MLINTVVDLAHGWCRLRRLDLSLELSRDGYPEDYSNTVWNDVLAHWRLVLETLKFFGLLQYVRVINWFEGYFDRTKWEPLAQALAKSQGSVCDKQRYLQDRLLEDGCTRNLLTRVWHIYPADTKSTTQGMVGLVSDYNCSSHFT